MNKEQVICDTPPNSLKDSNANLKVKTTDKKEVVIHSLIHNTSGVKRVCWSFGMKTTLSFHHSKKCMPFIPGWMTSKSIIHLDLYKLNNKLVSALLKHFWCTNEPHAYIDSQTSPQPEFGWKSPPSPLHYSLWLTIRLAPKCHFSQDSQVESLEIFEIWTFATLEAYYFLCKPLIEMRFKTSL